MMKTTRFFKSALVCAVAVMSAMMFTSCDKGGDSDLNPDPVVSITTQPTAPAAQTEGSIAGSLSVAATVTENAALTYQWYSNTTANNTGGTAINGATSANYALPSTLTAGTYYYFCKVSAYGAVSVHTDPVTVTVNATTVPPGASTETTAEFDHSNFGLYKGVIAGSSGTVRIEVGNGNDAMKATIVIDGQTDELTCTAPLTNGQAITDAAFTGDFSSFTFSVDADGGNPIINSIEIEGHDNVVVSVMKETSTHMAYCYEGTTFGGNKHEGVLNIVRSGNTFSGVGKSTVNNDMNDHIEYPLKGTINSDGTFSESVTVKGLGANFSYDPDVPGSQPIIEIDITLNYSGRFNGYEVSGRWTTLYMGDSNSGTFTGKKTL